MSNQVAAPVPGTRRKVMILGVDGGTLTLIKPWAEAGYLPTFARLMQEGCWGNLMSIIPPVSPAAWSSFLTGTNPGQHGVYDFVTRRPHTYDTWLCSASRRTGTPLWGLLGQAGCRVAVFNVPLTYPVQPVNGSFVGGMLTPTDATDATWPPELQAELKRDVPSFTFAPPNLLTPGEEIHFVEAIERLIQSNLDVAHHLMQREPWDFFMTVFMAADVTSHFLWKEMEEGQKPGFQPQSPTQARLATALRDCYQQVDAALGDLIEAAGPDVHLIIMSDHGFGRLERYFDINTWLLERGYLKLKRTPATLLKRALFHVGFTRLNLASLIRRLGVAKRARQASRYKQLQEVGIDKPLSDAKQRRRELVRNAIKKSFLSFADVDWSRTRLFALGFTGPIYVNLKGRDPQGMVEPGEEYDALLDQVAADLKAMREPGTGLPLVGDIYRPEQLYHGAHADEAPDLTIMPWDMKNSTVGMMDFGSNRWLTPSPTRSGMHRMEGILFLAGPGIRRGVHLDDSSIMDVAPTVLALLGVPIPTTLDGHVLDKAMTDELRASLNVTFVTPVEESAEGKAVADLEGEEEEKMREHLRGLGYVA